jgi:hypothetical protein
MLRRALLLGCFLAPLAGCGGSSSETPWPVEPDSASVLGPAGEQGPGAAADLADTRDAGAPKRKPAKAE